MYHALKVETDVACLLQQTLPFFGNGYMVRFECSQSKRCIKMQHFLSFLYLLTPTDEFLFEVEYYTANNLHPCKF